jgi:predicted metal-dependent enzyme (double-stranded beta helix superfamily)
MSDFLDPFVSLVNEVTAREQRPEVLIDRFAPALSELITSQPEEVTRFVETLEWPAPEDEMYKRVRVREGADGSWSLYAITWLEGQATPIHDHGTWGVVGVLKGALAEHMMCRVDGGAGDEGVELVPAGLCILQPGSVNTFMAEPDHIHRSGPLAGRTASLHLYGRLMTSYNMYDLEAKRRRPLPVE